MLPTKAPLAYAPRTTRIFDHKKRGRIVGYQTQTVFNIGEVGSAILRDVDPDNFEFVEEQQLGDNLIPAHWRGRVRQTDVILRGAVEPAEEVLTGRVELRLFQTENTFIQKAIGEDKIREDSSWHYLRVTFMGPAEEGAELQELTLGYDEPLVFGDHFGPARKGNSVWVSNATQLDAARAAEAERKARAETERKKRIAEQEALTASHKELTNS